MRFRNPWTLDYRPKETTWAGPVRLQIIPAKKEQREFRTVNYYQTVAEAFEALAKLNTREQRRKG